MAKGVSKILAKSIKHRSRLPTTEAVRVNDADDNTDDFDKETGGLPEAIPDVSSVSPSMRFTFREAASRPRQALRMAKTSWLTGR